MIAKLTGVIERILTNAVIIDVNGVGYLVSASVATISKIGAQGEHVSLYIETHVREDSISLFGFIDPYEQEWFNLLCSVQGVGAKAALSILAVTNAEELPVVIAAQDKAMMARADGVGPKLATRIVTELKEKASKMAMNNTLAASPAVSSAIAAKNGGGAMASDKVVAAQGGLNVANMNGDAVSALVNLGYGRAEAFQAVTQVSKTLSEDEQDVSVEALIRESLKELSA